MQEQQGAGEEEADLPERDEGVGEVAMLLLTFLDPSELLNETPWRSAVNKVLPPSSRNEEDGHGHSPVTVKLIVSYQKDLKEELLTLNSVSKF